MWVPSSPGRYGWRSCRTSPDTGSMRPGMNRDARASRRVVSGLIDRAVRRLAPPEEDRIRPSFRLPTSDRRSPQGSKTRRNTPERAAFEICSSARPTRIPSRRLTGATESNAPVPSAAAPEASRCTCCAGKGAQSERRRHLLGQAQRGLGEQDLHARLMRLDEGGRHPAIHLDSPPRAPGIQVRPDDAVE